MTNQKSVDFGNISDEALAVKAQNGDKAAENELLIRSLPTVQFIASGFSSNDSAIGNDDFVQEALRGVMAAIKGFDNSKGVSFRTYSTRCAYNSVVSSLRKTKNNIFTVPLPDCSSDENVSLNPELTLLADEDYKNLLLSLENALSEKELLVLRLYLCGNSYKQIGEKLSVSAKSVDNALVRIRRKIKNLR